MVFRLTFLVCLISLLQTSVSAQTSYYLVKGTVTDARTNQPLSGASVFAENTTIGTLTNDVGEFKIWLPDGGYSLAVTYTGYETDMMRVSRQVAQEGPVRFELSEKVKALEEVSIVITNEVQNGWEKYGSFFLENFIGTSAFARECVIENPEDLRFYFYKKRNTLKVKADEPILVRNNALGYTIKFAIDSFVYNEQTKERLFTGQPLFEEMEGSATQVQTWVRNRAKAYNGSMLHFMRSLYNQTLTAEGFEVQFIVVRDGDELPVKLGKVYGALNYQKNDSVQVVHFRPNQPQMAVVYNREKPDKIYLDANPGVKAKTFQLSTLTVAADTWITIEKNGYYYDQKDVTINGYLAYKKVGDMLPYNYGISEITEKDKIENAATDSIFSSGQQKPDISVTKSELSGINQENSSGIKEELRLLFLKIESGNYPPEKLQELRNLLQKFVEEKEKPKSEPQVNF